MGLFQIPFLWRHDSEDEETIYVGSERDIAHPTDKNSIRTLLERTRKTGTTKLLPDGHQRRCDHNVINGGETGRRPNSRRLVGLLVVFVIIIINLYLWLYSPLRPWLLFQFLNLIHNR
jgi:hypothetical protein